LAQAFIIGEEFIGDDSVCLVLGDNIFYGQGFSPMLEDSIRLAELKNEATIFGYRVKDPENFGVIEFDKNEKVLSVQEKPMNPKSKYAAVGLYFYPNKVIEISKTIKPSDRGELEITTVNQVFLEEGSLNVKKLGRGFAWLDTGTHESLAQASNFIEVLEKRQGIKIACLEEIAFLKGWISSDRLKEIAQPMKKNEYGQYLLSIID
jgi:glucose-1-phosphate thymidylyltransferase